MPGDVVFILGGTLPILYLAWLGIERKSKDTLQYGMQRFHRAVSLTLLTLAGLILVVEVYRTASFYPRALLVAILLLFDIAAGRLSVALSPEHGAN
jgi:hypothetical protein